MKKQTVNNIVKYSVPLLLLLACGAAFAAGRANYGVCSLTRVTHEANEIFDSAVGAYYQGTKDWVGGAKSVAEHIFWSLAAIEFIWTAINWVLRKHEIADLISSVFFKVISILFFYWIAIAYMPTWTPMLLNGFQKMATTVSGGTTSGGNPLPTVQVGDGSTPSAFVSPSAVMDVGLCVCGRLLTAKIAADNIAQAVLYAFFTVIAAVIVLIAYFIIALQLLMTEVEACIVLFGGAVMLGFTGSRWTLPWGEKYFGYAVSVGVKIMVILLVISVGDSVVSDTILRIIGAGVTTAADGTSGFPPLGLDDSLKIMMISLIFAGTCWTVPSLAGSFLNGTPSMSAGTMTGPALAAASAVAGGVMLAAGAGFAAAGAGLSAVKSVASGEAKAKAGKAMSTASSAYQSVAKAGQTMLGLGGGKGGADSGGGKGGGGKGGTGGGTAGSPGADGGGTAGSPGAEGGGTAGSPGAEGGGTAGSPGAAAGSPGASGADGGTGSPKSATVPDGKGPGSKAPGGKGPGSKEGEGGPENAIAPGGAAKASGFATSEDIGKLTQAIEKMAAGPKKPSLSKRLMQGGVDKLKRGVDHMKTSDGHTGTTSIRFKHHED